MRGGFQRERTIFHDWSEMDWHSGVLFGKPQKSRLLPGCCIFKKKKKKSKLVLLFKLAIIVNLHSTKSYQGLYPMISSSTTSILEMSGHFTSAFQPLLSLYARENASHWLQLQVPTAPAQSPGYMSACCSHFFLKNREHMNWRGPLLHATGLSCHILVRQRSALYNLTSCSHSQSKTCVYSTSTSAL